ncbi:MAG: 2-hydroxychromene-2-carboxylate isomerase [Kofleriaceae bacterium]
MIIAKRLKGKAISAWLGAPGDAIRRAVTQVKSAVTSTPKRLDVYFDITDPWSYITAQAVARLVDAYPVELTFTTVTAPASDVNPQPALRTMYSLKDASELAEYYDVEFPAKREADAGMVRDIGSVLIRQRPAREQLACALELANALWTTDKKKLVTLMGTWGSESHGAVLPTLNTAYGELRKAGHYQGAMIHFDGTWYWGIDRLPYLESALAKAFGGTSGEGRASVVRVRPEAERGAKKLSEKSDKPLVCEMWFSFRSPYSYIALEQIEDALAPYGVPLTLKQIYPMVARGAQLPSVKRMYIAHDAKREADRLNIPFGEICDPLGTGVDNCLAIQHWANGRGAGLAFARSAMRGIWSEARDVSEYVDLKDIVERAGLPWEEAKAALTDPAGPKTAHDNAADLNGIGLWGVPSFRIGDFITWGQDRLPLLVDRLRRHRLATT